MILQVGDLVNIIFGLNQNDMKIELQHNIWDTRYDVLGEPAASVIIVILTPTWKVLLAVREVYHNNPSKQGNGIAWYWSGLPSRWDKMSVF